MSEMVQPIKLRILRSLILSILFLIKHNLKTPRQVVNKKAYDISRKGSHPPSTPTIRHQHNQPQNYYITNHRV